MNVKLSFPTYAFNVRVVVGGLMHCCWGNEPLTQTLCAVAGMYFGARAAADVPVDDQCIVNVTVAICWWELGKPGAVGTGDPLPPPPPQPAANAASTAAATTRATPALRRLEGNAPIRELSSF